MTTINTKSQFIGAARGVIMSLIARDLRQPALRPHVSATLDAMAEHAEQNGDIYAARDLRHAARTADRGLSVDTLRLVRAAI